MRSKLMACALALAATPALLAAQAQSNRAAGRSPVRTSDLPRHYVGGPTHAAISAADLMTRLYIYADDSMMGRDAYSEYNVRATSYIESEARRLGLEPAGEDGYFQYPLVRRSVDSSSTLSLDGGPLRLWTDFVPRDQGSGARAFDGLQVVYGGDMSDTAHLLSRDAAAGKVVLVQIAKDSAGNRNVNGVNRFIITQRFNTAAAIAVDFIDYAPAGYIAQAFQGKAPAVRDAQGPPTPSYFYVTHALAQSMLNGASLDATTPGTAGRTLHGAFRYAEERAGGRNVIGIIRGSDPALRNEFIAIGAHNDHVGFGSPPPGVVIDGDSVRIYNRVLRRQGVEQPSRVPTADEARMLRAALDSAHARNGGVRNDTISNGADDDGSGTVSVLELAEYFAHARVKPKRSLLFIWHVGEEYGMLGSGYFTAHPTVPRDSIIAELNIDMIGRGGDSDITGVTKEGQQIHGGPGYVQLIGSRRLSTELGDLVERVNTERRLGMHFDYALDANGHPQNIYCRSDHASYARWGIPVVFFTTGGHSDYHQVSDEPEYIDYNRMEKVATLVGDLAERIGNLDHRVVVDHPRPDPNGACQQ